MVAVVAVGHSVRLRIRPASSWPLARPLSRIRPAPSHQPPPTDKLTSRPRTRHGLGKHGGRGSSHSPTWPGLWCGSLLSPRRLPMIGAARSGQQRPAGGSDLLGPRLRAACLRRPISST
jgi:hypothetical protein